MSKIIKNVLIGTFFKEYTRFAQLQVVTAVAVFAAILDALDQAMFETPLDESATKGKDKELKAAFTATIPVYLGVQAKSFEKEILAIPEDNWITKGAIATVNAYVFRVSQTNGDITLESGTTLVKMRTVAMYIATTQGRQAMFDLFHGENAVANYSKARTEYQSFMDGRKAEAEDNKSENDSPDDSPDGTSMETVEIADETLQHAFADLGHTLANADLSKGQAGEIANMINTVTNHVQSLPVVEETETPETVEVAPVVTNKAENKQAASK